MMGSTSTLPPQLQEKVDITLKSLQRDLNKLTEPTADRTTKRKALERIQSETIGTVTTLDKNAFQQISLSVIPSLCKVFYDPVEKCRELAVTIVASFVKNLEDVTPLLFNIVPAIAQRLNNPVPEPSEEIRLELLEIMYSIVTGKSDFEVKVDIMLQTLVETLQDPFPEVKKKSCKLIIQICKTHPQRVSLHGDMMTKALLPVLSHRHSGVRDIALQALGAAILAQATGLNDTVDHLRRLTEDKSGRVREILYSMIGEWLLHLPDRYSYAPKLLPLLLAGLSDEIPKHREICLDYLDRIAALYEEENKKDLKDEVDFDQKENRSARARMGLRHFVRDNLYKSLPSVLEDMSNWNIDSRLRGANVLCSLATYAEEHITGYMNTILPALYKGCLDEENAMVVKSLRAAEIMGEHVDPNIYLQLVLPQARTGGGGATTFRLACLRTLGALIQGTPPSRLQPNFASLVTALRDPEFVYHENVTFVGYLVHVVRATVAKAGDTLLEEQKDDKDRTETIGYGLFCILLATASFEGSGEEVSVVVQESLSGLDELSRAHGFTSTNQLYGIYYKVYLTTLSRTANQWNRYSMELRLLNTLLIRSGPLVGEKEALETILPLFSSLVKEEREYEVRMGTFRLINRLVGTIPETLDSTHSFSRHVPEFLQSVLLSSGVWRAGRKAAAIRYEAMLAFFSLLDGGNRVTREHLSIVDPDALLKVVLSCMEDDNLATRRVVLKVFDRLMDESLSGTFTEEQYKSMYPELLKRLDDANDEIRIQTCTALCRYFESMMKLEMRIDDVHWNVIVRDVAIHLDDTNEIIRDAVRKALESAARLCPVVMREQLEMCRSRHRNPRLIDGILEGIQKDV